MASYTRKLKDSDGNYIIPATRSSCVYMSDNTLLEDYLNSKFSDLEQKIQDSSSLSIYPVGSMYQSTDNTSPASLFGGTWEKIENMFLYGSGARNPGYTGGESDHALSISELPFVSGTIRLNPWITLRNDNDSPIEYTDGVFYAVSDTYMGQTMQGGIPTGTKYRTINMHFGEGKTHTNMPPFYTVNIWRRTA